MIHIDNFIADITSSNYFKDNPHLVDTLSIKRWVDLAMKSMGKKVMTPKSKVVHVQNYKAFLGKEYGGLKLAAWCKADNYKIIGNYNRVRETPLYRERIEKTNFTCAEGETISTEKTITEKILVDDGEIHLKYRDPVYVKLGRNVVHDKCNKGCLSNNESPYSINIYDKEVNANFKEGHLYIEYYALPYTEDGDILIPESDLGYFEQYLEAMVKRNILEEAMMSKDSTSLSTMFSYYLQKESDLETKARKDLSPIGLQSFWNLIDEKYNYNKKYQINLGR